jgi:hypothetical protein
MLRVFFVGATQLVEQRICDAKQVFVGVSLVWLDIVVPPISDGYFFCSLSTIVAR